MILQALVKLYERLDEQGEVARYGLSMVKVSYALHLDWDGSLVGVDTLTVSQQLGKKQVDVPVDMLVPDRVVRSSGIAANFMCDNSSYMLGVDNKGKPQRAAQCFEAMGQLHHRLLDGVDSPEARAVLKFFDTWRPERASECELLKERFDDIIKGSNLVFAVGECDDEGCNHYAHEARAIIDCWYANLGENADAARGACLVTGKPDEPVMTVHKKIMKVQGAQSSGAALVSFNMPAAESYGMQDSQGLNAHVSEYAGYAYATALNYLLADRKHCRHIGDTTLVYWAMSGEPEYQDEFAMLAGFDAPDTAEDQRELNESIAQLCAGKWLDRTRIDPDMRFCILGLSPNAARISVRFFIQDSFGNLLDNVAEHYRRMEIEKLPGDYRYVSPYWLLQETVNKKSTDKSSSPLLTGSVLRAIFSNTRYPEALFSSVMLRIRAEHDINSAKAGIIRAYLLKNALRSEEVMTVALNPGNTDTPYVLGRLFYALEKTQTDANPGINATIKDKYFGSACETPATVFPVLIKLAQHHIAKMEEKKAFFDEKLIEELLDMLIVNGHAYPERLTLQQQGDFQVGYYQQRAASIKAAMDRKAEKHADENAQQEDE